MKAKAYIVHQAMAEPSLEWIKPSDCLSAEPLYTAPQPSKPWQRLTEAEVTRCWNMTPLDTKNNRFGFYLALEAKLREKNT